MSKSIRAFKKHWRDSHKESFCHYCKVKLNPSYRPHELYDGISQNDNNFTIDHFLPKAEGGKDSRENFIVCCFKCNNIRGKITSYKSHVDKIKVIEEYIKLKPQIADAKDFFKYVFRIRIPIKFLTNYG